MLTKYLLVAIFTIVLASTGLLAAVPVSAHGGGDNRLEIRREVRIDEDDDDDIDFDDLDIDIDDDDEDELRTELRVRQDLDNAFIHPSLVHGLGFMGNVHGLLNNHFVNGLGFADFDDEDFRNEFRLRVREDVDGLGFANLNSGKFH